MRASARVALTFGGGSVHPLLKLAKTYDIPAGLNANAHFIPIICAAEHQTVNRRADQASKDSVRLSDRATRTVVVGTVNRPLGMLHRGGIIPLKNPNPD